MSRHLLVIVLAIVVLIVVGSSLTATILGVRALRRRAERLEIERRRHELHTAVANLARVALPDRLEGVARGIELLRDEGVASAVRSSIASLASGALSDAPRVRRAAAPDGTLTLMFSDIEGSTAINQRLGDRGWLGILEEHNRIVREQLRRHRGDEVKSQGDGFMLAFKRPGDGVACAIATQRAIAARRWKVDGRGRGSGAIRVRMGLHCGEAVRRGDDFLGLNVAIAARVAQEAHGGEILLSAAMAESLDGETAANLGEPRRVRLKGIADAQLVFPIAWSTEG
ncbi:MAG TPA: adenylate/guanylate cyclase domain-containing protein [Candidatus Dormibacteraeota bacterium]